MKVLITGADGFIGKNLRLHLAERKDVEVTCFTRANTLADLPSVLIDVDFVFHLAGINRSEEPQEFMLGNSELTDALCQAVCALTDKTGKKPPILYTSSIQANQANLYGQSKLSAELALQSAKDSHGIPVHIFRLPNVFGKWSKPNYNSVVATFCHNIARGLPIHIVNPVTPLALVYVDDVISKFIGLMDGADAITAEERFSCVTPQYTCTVGELAQLIQTFKDSRDTLMIERVGTGWMRALYSTYVSYIPAEDFVYSVPQHRDPRGVFVEMLHTPDCGQFSFFTAHPGVTRGGHYHHSKTEKFLVIRGQACFKFRHMQTGEMHELITDGEKAEVVETVPGWTHDITNIGVDEMIVMLWANEVFDRAHPDTIACSP